MGEKRTRDADHAELPDAKRIYVADPPLSPLSALLPEMWGEVAAQLPIRQQLRQFAFVSKTFCLAVTPVKGAVADFTVIEWRKLVRSFISTIAKPVDRVDLWPHTRVIDVANMGLRRLFRDNSLVRLSTISLRAYEPDNGFLARILVNWIERAQTRLVHLGCTNPYVAHFGVDEMATVFHRVESLSIDSQPFLGSTMEALSIDVTPLTNLRSLAIKDVSSGTVQWIVKLAPKLVSLSIQTDKYLPENIGNLTQLTSLHLGGETNRFCPKGINIMPIITQLTQLVSLHAYVTPERAPNVAAMCTWMEHNLTQLRDLDIICNGFWHLTLQDGKIQTAVHELETCVGTSHMRILKNDQY